MQNFNSPNQNNFIGLLSKDISILAMQMVKNKLSSVQNLFSYSQPNPPPNTPKRRGSISGDTKQNVDDWFEI